MMQALWTMPTHVMAQGISFIVTPKLDTMLPLVASLWYFTTCGKLDAAIRA